MDLPDNAHRQRRDRRRRIRRERSALRKRRILADRRPFQRRRRRRGVGLPALKNDLDPAGRKLTGTEATGNAEFGASVALASKEGELRADRRPCQQQKASVRRGCSALGLDLDPAGRKLTGAGRAALATSATAWHSPPGEHALIGGPGDNKEVGAAWVFTRSGSTWTQQGEKLTGSGEIHEGESSGKGAFGFSVALSAGGEYALIGGPGDNGGVGAAWVFTALGHDLDPAGRKAHRQRRDRRGRIRLERGAVRKRRIRADRRPRRQRHTPAPRGCSRARARPGPSRAQSSPAAGRPAKATSAGAWRCLRRRRTTR